MRYVDYSKIGQWGDSRVIIATKALKILGWKPSEKVKISIPENKNKIIVEKETTSSDVS